MRTTITHKRAGDCLVSDAAPRLHGSDCLPVEGPLPEKVHEVPQDPFRIAAVLGPIMATMSASCIIKDEATGVTYMDNTTTSVG